MKKKLLQIVAAGTLVAASLLPVVAHAANYYPDYTCYYRDISGSCLNYQTSDPYYFNNTANSLYGNRRSLTQPFNSMYNAYSTTPNTWDNRYNNRKNRYYDASNSYRDGNWEWYFDESDFTYRPYRFQADNTPEDDTYYYRNGRSDNSYYEYESTRIICTGRDCDTQHIRY